MTIRRTFPIIAAMLLSCISAFAQNEVKVDTMSLAEVKLDLEETVVTADRKVVVYKLDKKTISASSDIFAAGGTAVDILESTPSIRVDADGEITFRGSTGFTVYVNGKPVINNGEYIGGKYGEVILKARDSCLPEKWKEP